MAQAPSRAPGFTSACAERRVEVYFAGEEAREQTGLHFEDAAVADRVAEARVRDERVQASFVGFEHLLSAAGRERAGPRACDEVQRAHFAVVDEVDDDRVGDERAEL